MTGLPALPRLDDAALASLRALFARVGYRERELLELTGLESFFSATRSVAEVNASLADGGPPGLLARVMLFGARAPADAFAALVAPARLDDWIAWGLAERVGDDQVRSCFQLYPVADLVMLFDRPHHEDEVHPDHVMSLGAGTNSLRFLAPRGPNVTALDLGTGAGTLLLLAARDNARGFGIDINPRAIAMAKLNAALNQIDNVDFDVGDMFALEGDGYDAVYAQPPFAIRPDAHLVYRDAGGRGDEMVREAVRLAGRKLKPGATACIFCNWIIPVEGDPSSRIAEWVDGLTCDTLVLGIREEQPAEYAERWIRGPAKRGAVDPSRLKQWLDHYEDLGVGAFMTGVICLRRRAEGPVWLNVAETPERVGRGAARDLQHMFAALDALTTLAPGALLDRCLVAPATLRLRQELAPGADGWGVTTCTSWLSEGLMFELNHDAAVGDLVMSCDGKTPLRQICARLAEKYGYSVEAVQNQMLELAPMLLSYGLLHLTEA